MLTPVSTAPWLDIGTSVALADLDHDGNTDLVAAADFNSFREMVHVRMGNGDGTFPRALDFAGSEYMHAVAIADLDGDSQPDLVLTTATGLGPDDRAHVLTMLGRGDGTFEPPATVFAASAQSEQPQVAIADFDNDGGPDLAIESGTQLSLWHGRGDGTFASGSVVTLDYADSLLSVFDADDDGNADVVLTGEGTATDILRGHGNGTLDAPTVLATNSLLLAAGDVNGDGRIDLVEAFYVPNYANFVPQVLLASGDGTYHTSVLDDRAQGVTSAAIGDFNGDGKLDIATNGTAIYAGNGDGSFQNATYVHTVSPLALKAANLDNDGYADLLAVGDGATSIRLGAPNRNPFHASAAAGGPPFAVVDLDGDGHDDLASNPGVFLGGKGSLQAVGGVAFQSLADVDGDGHLDALIAHNIETVTFGNGDGTFGRSVDSDFENACLSSNGTAADLDGDGVPDLIASGVDQEQFNFPRVICVFLGNRDGTFRHVLDMEMPYGATILGSFDANQDGKPDVLVNYDGATQVMLGDGTGALNTSYTYPVDATVAAIADLDGDGNADVVQVQGAVAISLGNGDGTLKPTQFVADVDGARGVAIGDVDHDGQLDLLVARDTFMSVLLGNGDGTFRPGIDYDLHDGGRAAALVDIDGDGMLDFVVQTQAGQLIYWFNRCAS